jgi:thiol-disulfide isomerase/thioredoxin
MANRMTGKTKVIVAIAVVVAVALIGIVLGGGLSSPSEVALPFITWNETSLFELRGTPVVLNFWTTWCPACRTDLRRLDAVAKQNRGEIKVVAINVGEGASEVQGFFSGHKPNMIVALDENRKAFVNYARAYNNTRGFIPFTLFVDSEGIVQYAKIGAFASEAELRNVLRNALGISIP